MYVDGNGDFPISIIILLAIPTIIGGLIGAFIVPTDQEQNIIDEEGDCNDEQQNNDLNDNDNTGQRIINTIVGAGLGLAAGGVVSVLGGLTASLMIGGKTVVSWVGLTGFQMVGIGGLAINSFAYLIGPIFGIEIESFDYEVEEIK